MTDKMLTLGPPLDAKQLRTVGMWLAGLTKRYQVVNLYNRGRRHGQDAEMEQATLDAKAEHNARRRNARTLTREMTA